MENFTQDMLKGAGVASGVILVLILANKLFPGAASTNGISVRY